MLFQIISFLLDVVVGLLTGVCLLRVYMQAQRVPFGNPVGQLVFALSDWIVLPLRRIIKPAGRWDMASLVAAFLLQMLQYVLLWLLVGSQSNVVALPWLALCGLARVALSGMVGVLLVYVILSWVQTQSPLFGVVQRLSEPMLRPIRRIVPLIGGIDLSALVALVLLQVALMVLGYVQGSGLMLVARPF
ncbi:MAG: YggT family protein [Burkholderiaceae bacterium]|jgi:YggT family protein|nr:YggT family protein [Burkholderiaceae bacterium]